MECMVFLLKSWNSLLGRGLSSSLLLSYDSPMHRYREQKTIQYLIAGRLAYRFR